MRTDSSFLRSKAKKEAKVKVVHQIPKASKKYAKELAIYNKRTPSWKLENPFCAAPGCRKPTVDRHHMGGRGILLNDERFHLPLCKEHHDICKSDPKKALEMKLILTRIVRDYLKENSDHGK